MGDFESMVENKDVPEDEKGCDGLNQVGPAHDLKAAREALGLTLDDLFSSTRVSLTNLQAVENEDFDHLPPPVYARNFIRKYARAVGVDENPLLDRYARHVDKQKPLQEETEVRKPWPETGRQYRFLFLSLAAVIVAGTLVYAIFLYDQSGKPLPPAATVETPAQPLKPASAVEPASPPGQPAPSAQKAPEKASSPVTPKPAPAIAPSGKMQHLTIEARELTWIRITEDNTPSYQTMLKPGDKIERMASEYFILDVGNAGGINVTFAGKNLGSLGKKGQIVHIRLPEKSPERKTP